MKRKLAALLVILNIFICFSLPCSAESGAGSGLNIVFTGNIHSHIENYSYISDYIRNERTANPDTIALDCGNFSAGTVYQTLFTSFAPELRLAGASGYDAVALGAYEYSYGTDGIKEMLLTAGKSHETLPAILCADPAEVVPASDRYDNAVKRYTLIKRGGYSVAVFSVYDTESFKEAANITDEVKKLYTPDLIVCLFGAKMLTRDFAYEKKLAASADIDLIISANENLIYGDPLYSDGTFIVPAGVNGLQAGEITFEFSNGKIYCKRYVYTTKESYKSTDSAVAAKAAGFAEYAESYFNAYGYESADEVIAKSTYSLPFEPSDEKSASLYELIADSFVSCVRELEDKQFNGVDIVLISVNSIGNGINEGNITVSDIFSILPFGDRAHVTCGSPLCSFYIKGDEIINLCEADMSLSNTDPELEYYISGVHYRANTTRIKFNRVFGCMLTDDYGVREIEDEKLYRVVSSLDTLNSIEKINKESFGLISVIPRNKDGNEIEDTFEAILHDAEGNEILQWKALADNLLSFREEDGTAILSDVYTAPRYSTKEIFTGFDKYFFTGLNAASWIVFGGVAFALLFVVAIILIIFAAVRRHKKKVRAMIALAEGEDDEDEEYEE